jgi:hypothetical protein
LPSLSACNHRTVAKNPFRSFLASCFIHLFITESNHYFHPNLALFFGNIRDAGLNWKGRKPRIPDLAF